MYTQTYMYVHTHICVIVVIWLNNMYFVAFIAVNNKYGKTVLIASLLTIVNNLLFPGVIVLGLCVSVCVSVPA